MLGNPTRLIKFKAQFIIGYQLSNSDLFYEIWFLPFKGKYVLVDKFGKRSDANLHRSITHAVDDLLDIISTKDRQKIGREFEREASRANRVVAGVEIDETYVQTLFETSAVSRKLFIDVINSNVKEYNSTRMDKSKISKLWSIPLGRSLTYPSKYIGGSINKLFKIIGKDREATFVVGYTFNNKIDIEIWIVKSLITGKGSFYVFDITSAKLIASKLPNMRTAYATIANKIVVEAD